MNKRDLIIFSAGAAIAAAGLNTFSQQEPYSENISKLDLSEEDQNRLLYLQATLRTKLDRNDFQDFSSWKSDHPFPEYDDLSQDKILNERDAILFRNGYPSGTLTWNFHGSHNNFSESLHATNLPLAAPENASFTATKTIQDLRKEHSKRTDNTLKRHSQGHSKGPSQKRK
ncbi:hypothetical protein CVV38_00440 [Candidatus Peregrinibacteria bacterium HGW-Peregrinibacteria-1]|jgi:hypothetical protein|nr:MAG: hypothetical protein CVV38_00440 [Candidatus Peregrinibacteria bacterium HGW-Peregrinibacteria-1]